MSWITIFFQVLLLLVGVCSQTSKLWITVTIHCNLGPCDRSHLVAVCQLIVFSVCYGSKH